MVRKISLALAMMTIAGVASATSNGGSPYTPPGGDGCIVIPFINFSLCLPGQGNNGGTAQAPEIDPASAMAGLSMLAGGLAVLRGRRSK